MEAIKLNRGDVPALLAALKVVGTVPVEAPVDPEQAAFVEVVSAGLPSGEDLTASELRCDYLLEKLSEEHGRLGHLCEFSDRRVQMVREHQAIEAGKLERRIAWLESQIRAHTPGDAERFKTLYGRKSLALPHGKVGFKASGGGIEITDSAKVLAFARKHGLEIKTTHTVNKTPLQEWVQKNGEEPDPETDGFMVVPAADQFFVKPEGI